MVYCPLGDLPLGMVYLPGDFFWFEVRGLWELVFFGGSFGLGVMEGLGGWLIGGRAGRISSVYC